MVLHLRSVGRDLPGGGICGSGLLLFLAGNFRFSLGNLTLIVRDLGVMLGELCLELGFALFASGLARQFRFSAAFALIEEPPPGATMFSSAAGSLGFLTTGLLGFMLPE
jgi:hypothetical protein